MKRILSCVFTSVLISAAVLPCAAQDQGETNFQKVVSALSGKWSIRETSDHGETTGEEVWQRGAGGMPFTEEFRASMSTGAKLMITLQYGGTTKTRKSAVSGAQTSMTKAAPHLR
jgi:hypothetical protein